MLRHVIFLLALSIGVAACDRAANDDAAADSALNQAMPAADVGGARADRPDPATPAPADSVDAGETAAAAPDRDLPDTASALPLAGVVALLSLGGAAVLRARRR